MNPSCMLTVYSSINGHMSDAVELSPLALDSSLFLADRKLPWNLRTMQCSGLYSTPGSSSLRNLWMYSSILVSNFLALPSGYDSRNAFAKHGNAVAPQSMFHMVVSDDSMYSSVLESILGLNTMYLSLISKTTGLLGLTSATRSSSWY